MLVGLILAFFSCTNLKQKYFCILVWMKVTFAWKLEKRRSNTFRDSLLDRQNNLWEIVLLVLFLHAVETTSVKAFVFSSGFSCKMHCIYIFLLRVRGGNSKIDDDEAPRFFILFVTIKVGGMLVTHPQHTFNAERTKNLSF